ncbi:hypothetical protein V6N13_121606 [Hibiscus sabdariffa]|uniref:BZIP domain-containing protein n=1 Tax=Hibiscus sabdariffa TaxID=183260 RepID=A0ABR2PDA3_9ROSI
MATVQRSASSSDFEWTRKRMMSNRESRIRKQKQKQLKDLGNEVLRAQAMELTERLRSLNLVLHIVEEVSWFVV